ncbi:uncharacterized protein J3D65DRAFT_623020, partial [Phyllosticta citribraziliensis]
MTSRGAHGRFASLFFFFFFSLSLFFFFSLLFLAYLLNGPCISMGEDIIIRVGDGSLEYTAKDRRGDDGGFFLFLFISWVGLSIQGV